MSKMGEYAMERAIAEAKHKPRIQTKKPGNVPVALCEQHADAHIAGCIKEGWFEVLTTRIPLLTRLRSSNFKLEVDSYRRK